MYTISMSINNYNDIKTIHCKYNINIKLVIKLLFILITIAD